jgi:hypothetical protein
MRKNIIFISFALIGYIPSISFADPMTKAPNWIKYEQSNNEKFPSSSFYDSNSAKKSGVIVTIKTAVIYDNLQTALNYDTNKPMTFRSQKYTVQVDCKYKTMKRLDREYYADDGAIKEFGDRRYKEDLSHISLYSDWVGVGSLSTALPKLCK